MSKNPTLTKRYHIPLDMFMDAFRAFQRKYVYPQNIVLSVILLAVAGVYVYAAVRDSSKTLPYIVIVFCVAFVMSTWYKTLKMRRSLREALKEIESDTYEMKLFSDKLTIRTEDAVPVPAETAASLEAEEVPGADPEPAEDAASEDAEGFNSIFPVKPAEPVQDIPPTEIFFEDRVKIHEFAEYFMVYLVKRNFYLIPKKDFSENELTQLRTAFKL